MPWVKKVCAHRDLPGLSVCGRPSGNNPMQWCPFHPFAETIEVVNEWVERESTNSEEPQVENMRYKIQFSKTMMTADELNELYLRENWELVGIIQENEGYYYHFKREVF